MIDERREENTALYAFDLLEGQDRTRFEADLDGDPRLRALAASFRNTASVLAFTAPAVPPPTELRARVLAAVAPRPAALPPAAAPAAKVIRPDPSVFARFAPWGMAAGLAVAAAWFGQRYLSVQSETRILRDQQAMTEVALKSLQQQLEAERIVTRRQIEDLGKSSGAAAAQVQQAQAAAGALTAQLAERDRLVAEARSESGSLRGQLAKREADLADLSQRVVALTRDSALATRELNDARDRIARLLADMKTERDLANFKITMLASLVKDSPQANAVAVWDPAKQEGILQVEKLPALAANQDYQLWVVDPQYPIPVDAGVFTVDPASGAARFDFKAKQPVAAVAAFAVSLERKGGVPKAEGQMMLLGK
jgi:anti-sigma-K factor RskA